MTGETRTVRLADIRPNPFRDLTRYPVSPAKVEALRRSMRTTGGLWIPLSVRHHTSETGLYELAAGGHARLEAMRVDAARQGLSDVAEVEVRIRDHTDEEMLRMLANENAEEWGLGVKHDREMVRVARQHLLSNPGLWKRTTTNKDAGPGPRAIARLLGGVWAKATKKIASHLEILVPEEGREVEPDIVESLRTLAQQRRFVPLGRGQSRAVQQEIARTLDAAAPPSQSSERDLDDAGTGNPLILMDDRQQALNLAAYIAREVVPALATALKRVERATEVLEALLATEATRLQLDMLLLKCAVLARVVARVLEWGAAQAARNRTLPPEPPPLPAQLEEPDAPETTT